MDARITEITQAQHGVVSRRQALAAGVSAATLDAMVYEGRLVRVACGVYLVPGAPMTARTELMVAVLRCGPDATVVGERALALHGVVGADPRGPFTVVAAPGRHLSNVPWQWRNREPDWPVSRAELDGIPTVCLEWNLLEAAVDVSDADLERLSDGVRWQGRRTVRSVRRLMRLHRETHAGARRLDESGLFADDAAESPPERTVEAALAHHHPQRQVRVLPGLRVDLLIPHARLVIEYQGFGGHSSSSARAKDTARRQRLEAAGYLVLYVHADDLRDLPGLVAKVDLLVEVRTG